MHNWPLQKHDIELVIGDTSKKCCILYQIRWQQNKQRTVDHVLPVHSKCVPHRHTKPPIKHEFLKVSYLILHLTHPTPAQKPVAPKRVHWRQRCRVLGAMSVSETGKIFKGAGTFLFSSFFILSHQRHVLSSCHFSQIIFFVSFYSGSVDFANAENKSSLRKRAPNVLVSTTWCHCAVNILVQRQDTRYATNRLKSTQLYILLSKLILSTQSEYTHIIYLSQL